MVICTFAVIECIWGSLETLLSVGSMYDTLCFLLAYALQLAPVGLLAGSCVL